MTKPITQRIRSYNAWRRRDAVRRPLLGLAWEPEVPPLPEMLDRIGDGNEVMPHMVQPSVCTPYIERWHRQESHITADVIKSFAPAFGIPWIEAMAGCPVIAHPGSLWAATCLADYAGRPPIHFDPENPWLLKLVEFTRAMVDSADHRFPVALPPLRGPLDTLAAMRTPVQMCLDLVDRPDEVRTLLAELTDLWIGAAQAVLSVIPPFHGGYCSRLCMWVPGPAVTPQNDVSSLLSRQMFEEFVLPCDRRIVEYFPYHSYHTHSTEYHQLDTLLRLEDLTAIQMFLQHDSGGPPMPTVVPAVRRVLERKPMLLGAMDTGTADWCLEELPAAGLCLMLASDGSSIPESHRDWLELHCARATGSQS